MFCSCSRHKIAEFKDNNYTNTLNFKDSVLNTKPFFENLKFQKSTFRYIYTGQVHTLKSTFYIVHDSIITINLFTPFHISLLNFNANKERIEIFDKSNSIIILKSYNDFFQDLSVPLQFNDLINIIVGQGFFPYNATVSQIPNRVITMSKNILSDKYSVNIDGTIYNIISKYLLPYNKLISRDIYNSKGEVLLRTHYIVIENSIYKLPKEVTIEFIINGDKVEIEYQIPNL
jgi:hypothetical protein